MDPRGGRLVERRGTVTKLAVIRSSPNVVDGSRATTDLVLKADVCIVGTGAGGAVTAATLARAGSRC